MSVKRNSENTVIATTKEISAILGLSDRRIRQLENEGALVKIAHGKFDLPESIQTYINVIKEQSETQEEMDLNKERTLLTRANRLKVEMELKIMRGELHRSEDVESIMNDMIASCRAQLLVVPGKVAPQVLGQNDVEIVKDTVKKIVFEALQELSEYDPHVFYAKSKDRISVDIEEHSEEKEDKRMGSNEKRKTTKK